MKKKYAIGADVGGSHISCAAIDLDQKQVLDGSYFSHEVNNQAAAEEILEDWAIPLKKSLASIDQDQLTGIGFAMPGPFDYAKGVALFKGDNAKYQSLNGLEVSERLKNHLGRAGAVEIRYMNDATSFAVGEAWFGKAAGAMRSVSITLGTGFGAAFIEEGVPVVDGEKVPEQGCLWHLPFNGKIADEWFSTRWFVNRYAEKSGHKLPGARQVAEKAAGDAQAREVFDEFGSNLGNFLGRWLGRFGADTLVIGGNVSAAYPLFGERLRDSLREQRLENVGIHISELKEDAALIGSARLFEEEFWEKVRPLLGKM